MKWIKFKLLCLWLIGPLALSGQHIAEESILGTWELVKEDRGPSIIDPSVQRGPKKGAEVTPDIVLYFQPNGVIDFIQGGQPYKTRYELHNSILLLGESRYNINHLSKDSLVLKQLNSLSDGWTYYYVRSSKQVEPMSLVEPVYEYYDNGKLKLEGRHKGGFRDGIWIAHYESGAVKQITYYNEERVLMVLKFDEDGTVTSKRWLDLKSFNYQDE